MSEEDVDKIVRGRSIAPRATKILYARHTFIVKKLVEAGMFTREEMDKETDAMVRDIEASQAVSVRQELGLDKEG